MPRLRRFIRWTAGLVTAFCVLLIALAVGANYFLLDAAHLGPLINQVIQRRSGLELTVGHLQIRWYPPHVEARDVTVSRPDGSASADRVAFDLDLSNLMAREINVKAGEIDGLTGHFPDDFSLWPGIIREVRDQILATRRDHPLFTVEIESIAAAARVYLGYENNSAATGQVRVANLLSDRIGLTVDATLDDWGNAARVYGSVDFMRAEPGSPWQMDGEAWLDGVQTETLPVKNMPEAEFGGRFVFYPTDAGPGIGFTARLDSPKRPELTGEMSAAAVWDGDRVRIGQGEWLSRAAHASVSGEYASPDNWHLTLAEANATEAPLDALLALVERPRARFEAETGATISARGLDIAEEDGSVRVASGELQFDGISVVPIETPTAGDAVMEAARGLRGSLSSDHGAIQVHEIRGAGLRVSGSVTPDTENHLVLLDLTGDIDLARFPLAALNDSGAIERLRGRATVSRFRGTFRSGEGVPDDLTIEGTLRDGALRYRTSGAVVKLDQINGQFKTSKDGVVTIASARGSTQSPISLNGAYDVKTRRWTGVLDADPEPLVSSTFEEASHVEQLVRAARIAGPSRFNVALQFPSGKDGTQLDVAREANGGPAISAHLEFGSGLRVAHIETTVPGDRLVAEYFPRLQANGNAHGTFDYNADTKKYVLDVDATHVALGSNTILRKADGTEMTLHASGVPGDPWTVTSADLLVAGRTLLRRDAAVKGGRFPFEVTLDALPPLLAEGATATGTVRGTLKTDPMEGELQLVNATLALNPVLTFDRIDGAIAFAPNMFRCENLAIRGARSDCTFSLVRQDGRWTGRAQGPQLDMEAVTEVIDAARLLNPNEEDVPAAPRSLWDRPTLGEFVVQLGRVYYRRGQLDTLHLRILGEERAIRFTEFSAKPGGGEVLGSFVIVPGETSDAVLKLAAKWQDMDGTVVNDIILPEDRGFYGKLTGELTFDAPYGPFRDMMAAGNGSVTMTGKDGSLGRIGFASALLTTLKTTEIINLRAPTLRDRGLVYDKLNSSLKMNAGVMTVDDFSLDGGAYTMTAKGSIDFAREQTDVDAFVRVLESVGRIVRKIPLIGDLATALSTDLIGVPAHFSGSPYKVQAGVMAATGKSVLSAPVRAGEGALKAVGETFKKLTPGGNNKNDKKQ